MKTSLMRVAVGVLLVALAGCASSANGPISSPSVSGSGSVSPSASPSVPPPVKLTSKDDGRTVNLVAGQRAILDLSTNGSTGYQWKVTRKPTTSVVAIVGHKVIPPKQSSPPAIGAASDERWTFQAVAAGTTSFAAEYVGPTGAMGGSFKVSFAVSAA